MSQRELVPYTLHVLDDNYYVCRFRVKGVEPALQMWGKTPEMARARMAEILDIHYPGGHDDYQLQEGEVK